jgi:membrane protein YqaA with SNARE-associated domain
MIHAFVRFFVSLPGAFVLGLLDATFFFTLPLGIDAVIVTLAARRGVYFWMTPLLATAGSLVGAALTYWTGMKIGEAGLSRFASERWLTHIKRRLKGSAVALAALDLLPPPFPFSAFVLAAGTANTDRRKFFITLAGCRMLRFGAEALLGLRYGRYALRWIESETVERLVAIVVMLAIAASLLSLGRLRRGNTAGTGSARPGRRPTARFLQRNRSRALSPASGRRPRRYGNHTPV